MTTASSISQATASSISKESSDPTEHTLTLTAAELDFLRQLFESDLAVTIKTVEVIAGLRRKVMAQPTLPTNTEVGAL
jgi:hypothetical protein